MNVQHLYLIAGLILWFIVSIYELATLQFVELDKAVQIINQNCIEVMILVSVAIPMYMFIKAIKQGFILNDSFYLKARKVLFVFVSIGALFLMQFIFIQGIILIVNRHYGKQEWIVISSEVKNEKIMVNKRNEDYYFTIYAEELQRNITLRSKLIHRNGLKFSALLQVGSMGIVYRK